MKFLTAMVFILVTQNIFASDSILGREIDAKDQVGLPSLLVRYAPTTMALGNEEDGFGEEHDIHVFEIGLNGSYPLYSRLYFEGGLGAMIANVDDSLYGDGNINWYGFYSELGIVHKTFFGQKKSYDFGFRVGISGFLSGGDLTNKNGELTDVDHDGLSLLYFEPAIGINYNQFAILIGYKFVTDTVFNNSMPTLALKYYF